MDVVAGPSGSVRPYLRFPPPPPFPPEEYDYAYEDEEDEDDEDDDDAAAVPGPSGSTSSSSTSRPPINTANNTMMTTTYGRRHHHHHHHHHHHSQHQSATSSRYGTQENLYEEIGAMRLEEEVRYVHSKHLQVLDELNLSMEAMIMPVIPGSEQLTAELLSPASSSIDSGFSSSSTGTNSLGRPQPSKRKSPAGFWKRLPALVKSSTTKEPPPQPPHHPPHTCCKRKSKCGTTVRADEQRRKKIDFKI